MVISPVRPPLMPQPYGTPAPWPNRDDGLSELRCLRPEVRQGREQRSNRETLTPHARRAEAIPVRLDGPPSADDVARGAQVEVAHGRYDAAWIDAERTRCADVEVLIFDAEDHVEQRALVGHVVEAAARIPAAVVAHDAVSRAAQRAANTGDGRAMRVLDMGQGKAPGRKDQQPVPGVAHARARREQVDDLVLAEDVFFEALGDRQDAARAAAFVDASAARDFGAENPRPPLRLRAGVETEDGGVVAGGDVGSDRARRREMVRDVMVRPAGVEADVSAGPIVVRHWKRSWRLEWQLRRRRRRRDHHGKR